MLDEENISSANMNDSAKNDIIPVDWHKRPGSIIKVIGVGGCGNNAVKNMYNRGIEGVDFIICNTDEQVLNESPIPCKIQLGVKLTRGLGAGCNPEKGRNAAIENLDDIIKVLEDNTKMVFITAGMGGGTGTGAAPIIAKEAKSREILTIAIVTMPFQDEGEDPYKRALDGLRELRQHVDSLLVINNEKIYEIYPDMSVFDALPKADDILSTATKSIAEIITKGGYMNVDFADVDTVMRNSGMALMGTGRASGPNRAQEAAKFALESPLLNNNDIAGAKKILINISSGMDNPLKMPELRDIMAYIRTASGGKANFKRGLVQDSDLGEDIVVTIIATGFSIQDVGVDIGEDVFEPDVAMEVRPVAPTEVIITGCKDVDKTVHTGDADLVADITVREIEVRDSHEDALATHEESATVFPITYNLSQLKPDDIVRLEDQPAYLRNKKGDISASIEASEISPFKLEETNGGYKFGEDNSFLNKTVD